MFDGVSLICLKKQAGSQVVIEIAEGSSFEEVQAATGAPLQLCAFFFPRRVPPIQEEPVVRDEDVRALSRLKSAYVLISKLPG